MDFDETVLALLVLCALYSAIIKINETIWNKLHPTKELPNGETTNG